VRLGLRDGFTPAQVFETLPVVKQLGFGWAVLDDGWQVALGDWRPRSDKFPAGDADMKALVDRIHAAGLKAQLWWAPMGADAGSRTAREHPDWLLRNADGSTRTITWWDSQYLCPAVDDVRADALHSCRKRSASGDSTDSRSTASTSMPHRNASTRRTRTPRPPTRPKACPPSSRRSGIRRKP
jgi:hypothetical protein